MAHFAVTVFGNVIIIKDLVHNLPPFLILLLVIPFNNSIISNEITKVKPIAVLN